MIKQGNDTDRDKNCSEVFRILQTHIYTQQLKFALPSFLSRTPENAMSVWVLAE